MEGEEITWSQHELTTDHKLLACAACFCFFSVVFVIVWLVLHRYYNRFRSLTFVTRVDTVERINSGVHTIVLVPALIYFMLNTKWNDDFTTAPHNLPPFQLLFAFSIGYFCSDTGMLVLFKPPQWLIFVVHHCIAMTPIISFLFGHGCNQSAWTYYLALFLLVEFTNVSLHVQVLLEQNGLGGTRWYPMALYTTFFGWIIFRMAVPTAGLVLLHRNLVPATTSEHMWCTAPMLGCGYLITIFCYSVFFFILLKEVGLRWRSAPKLEDVAELSKRNRPLEVHPDILPISAEEEEITVHSPTLTFLYEAREVIHEAREDAMVLTRKIARQFDE